MNQIDALISTLRRFAEERDWQQFHSPKNVSMALASEVGELLEHFQWLTETQSKNLDHRTRAEVIDEMADVFIYLLRLSDELNVDLLEAAHKKIAKNALKYPVEKSRGRATKYTKLK